MARRVVSSHGDAGREAGQGSGSRKPRTTADRASSSGAEANRVAVTRERQTRKKPRTASNDVSRKAASGEASPGRTTVGKATGRQMTSGRKSEKALEKETSRQAKGGKTVSRKSRFGKTASRSVSSSSSRSVSRAEGFVDAPPAGVAPQAQHGRERPVQPVGGNFARRHFAHFARDVLVPRAGAR